MLRRTALRSLGLAAMPLAGCTGDTGDGTPRTATATAGGLQLTSPAFDDGATIPPAHTCDGADRSPRLDIAGISGGVDQLALLVDDPDAPSAAPFVHWVLYDLPGDTRTIPADVPPDEAVASLDAKQGRNGFGNIGYGGPCPPEGDGLHTYRFRLFGLAGPTGLDPGATRDGLLNAVEGRTVARGRLSGTYERG